jgi:hypothetical protein
MEPKTGIEPVTSSLPWMRSTTELLRHLQWLIIADYASFSKRQSRDIVFFDAQALF